MGGAAWQWRLGKLGLSVQMQILEIVQEFQSRFRPSVDGADRESRHRTMQNCSKEAIAKLPRRPELLPLNGGLRGVRDRFR